MRTGVMFFVLLASGLEAQHALLRRAENLHAVSATTAGVRSVVDRLFRGPTTAETQQGVTTAIPPNTRLLDLSIAGRGVTLTLSAEFLSLIPRASALEDAIEQIAKTVVRAGPYDSVTLMVKDASGRVRRLTDLLRDAIPIASPSSSPPSLPASGFGVLNGKTIAVSPSHGFYWHTILGWIPQRGLIDGLIEDIHTAEIANRYLIPALENMGARVVLCRERGEIPFEGQSDNDTGPYSSQGSWLTSKGGYLNRTFQFALTATSVSSTAEWTLAVPADGIYPVYAYFPVVSQSSPDARYTVQHSGGKTTVELDQRGHPLCWTFLGKFAFTKTAGAKVMLDNQSSTPGRFVIADALRIGGGMGSISRGTGTSGKPRWQECSRYWTQFAGAPSSVWNTTTGQDNGDDVTARPRYAEWRGADAFISLHTNAGGGTGTSSFIYNGTPSAGSAALQAAVHDQIVGDIHTHYDSSWTDRGRKSANFGEVRVLKTMPGVLLELAFHDRAGTKDHRALHDPRFRYVGGRAYARGVMRYFHKTAPFPPEPPVGLRVTQAPNRGLAVVWDSVSGATHYSIEQSPDGKGFVQVAQTNQTAWTTAPLLHGTVLSFRVRAWNASGRSFPTEVLTAGTSHTKRAELLMVQGFDRLGRYVKAPENTKDYLRLHGTAIRAASEFSLGFDAATNEAVQSGRVKLTSYRVVNWVSGEESTADESFSAAEQSSVQAYLNGGGRLLLSGAEVGWDLWAKGSSADRSFYTSAFGASYVQDDAQTYGFGAASGNHIFTGIASGVFDNGTGGTYDVDYPDVLAPADSRSKLCLVYSNGKGAAIQRENGSSRVVYLGFPLETITDAGLRAQIMIRALRFLLGPRAFEAAPTMKIGTTLTLPIFSSATKNFPYLLAASLQRGTIRLAVDHVVPLFPDPVLETSLQPNGIFVSFRGTLDGMGRGAGKLVVPNVAVARGVKVFVSGLTLQSGGVIRETLPWVRVAIQ